MILFLSSTLPVFVLGLLVWRRGRDQHVDGVRPAIWLRVIALIPLGAQVVFLLFFGIGEIASGDLSGVGHLFPVVSTAILAVLAWMRPLDGGIALLIIGLVTFTAYSDNTARLIVAAPQLASGVLFLIAGLLARKAHPPGSINP